MIHYISKCQQHEAAHIKKRKKKNKRDFLTLRQEKYMFCPALNHHCRHCLHHQRFHDPTLDPLKKVTRTMTTTPMRTKQNQVSAAAVFAFAVVVGTRAAAPRASPGAVFLWLVTGPHPTHCCRHREHQHQHHQHQYCQLYQRCCRCFPLRPKSACRKSLKSEVIRTKKKRDKDKR